MFVKMTGLLLITSFAAYAGPSQMYCPQKQGYIKIGMTTAQVVSACGQPLSKKKMNRPATEKVPMQQLFYNHDGHSTAFYGVWKINTGHSSNNLEVDVIDEKVVTIKLNGGNANVLSMCAGQAIQPGDPVSMVYDSCGNPSRINQTYINKAIQSNTKPESWTYQSSAYQAPFSLTFVNGKLQSIN